MNDGIFRDFNFWTIAVVLNNALNGLAISAILKYADNIVRVFIWGLFFKKKKKTINYSFKQTVFVSLMLCLYAY